MLIKTLDLSTRTGWARDDPNSPGRPVSGVFRCPGSIGDSTAGYNFGSAFARFEEWLRKDLTDDRPDIVVKEAPLKLLHPKAGWGANGKMEAKLVTSQNTIRLLLGLDAAVELVCNQLKINVYEVNVQKVKSHFVRGGAKKEEMVARCRQLGWDCGSDDNRADAMALWSFAKATLDPAWSPMSTPLFGRKGV